MLVPPVLVEDLLLLEPTAEVDTIGLVGGPIGVLTRCNGSSGGSDSGGVGLSGGSSVVSGGPDDSADSGLGSWLSVQVSVETRTDGRATSNRGKVLGVSSGFTTESSLDLCVSSCVSRSTYALEVLVLVAILVITV